MDFLPPSAPNLAFEHDICMSFYDMLTAAGVLGKVLTGVLEDGKTSKLNQASVSHCRQVYHVYQRGYHAYQENKLLITLTSRALCILAKSINLSKLHCAYQIWVSHISIALPRNLSTCSLDILYTCTVYNTYNII